MFDLIDNEEIAGIEKTAEDEKYENKLPRGYLSVSQVTQYMKCGEAYYRRYVLNEQIPSNSFQVQGRGVHKAAERLHLGLMEGYTMPIEEVEAVYSDLHDKEIVDAVIPQDEGTAGQIKDVGLRLARKYHKVALGNEIDLTTGYPVPAVHPIAAERTIRTKIQTEHTDVIPFVAVIDLEEEDAIADLKTKKQAGPQAEADNSIQLSLYAHLTGKAAVRLDQLVKPTKTLPERFIRRASLRNKKEVAHALDIVAEVADDISAGRFRKTNPEAWWCTEKWCPYWKDCRGRNRG